MILVRPTAILLLLAAGSGCATSGPQTDTRWMLGSNWYGSPACVKDRIDVRPPKAHRVGLYRWLHVSGPRYPLGALQPTIVPVEYAANPPAADQPPAVPHQPEPPVPHAEPAIPDQDARPTDRDVPPTATAPPQPLVPDVPEGVLPAPDSLDPPPPPPPAVPDRPASGANGAPTSPVPPAGSGVDILPPPPQAASDSPRRPARTSWLFREIN